MSAGPQTRLNAAIDNVGELLKQAERFGTRERHEKKMAACLSEEAKLDSVSKEAVLKATAAALNVPVEVLLKLAKEYEDRKKAVVKKPRLKPKQRRSSDE